MARVPQPALPAGPVGSVAPEARGAPGLRLDVSADMFGASMGRSISKVGQAAEQVVGFAVKKAEQEDALKLRQLENEVAELDNTYTTQVQGLSGQAKLDFLNNSVDRYKEDLAKVTDKYQFTFENNTAVKGIYSKQATNKFTNFALGQRQEAYKTVLTETNKVSLANSTQAAVNNPALLQEPAFLNKIRNLVTDTETGMAAVVGETGSTPESKQRIETLSKEVEMQVISAVVADQLAKGNLRDAAAIVNQAAKKGSGTKAYTQLQSQILPFQNRLLGMDEFATLLTNKTAKDGTPPPLSSLLVAIAQEANPDKRDRLQAEYAVYSASKTAELTQRIKDQGALFVQALINGQSIADPKLIAQIPDYLSANGTLTLGIFSGAKDRAFTAEVLKSKEETAYENQGGGLQIIPGLTRTIKEQFRNNPAAGLAIMSNPNTKRFLTLQDNETLADLAKKARNAIETQQNKVPVMSVYLQREFGFTKSEIEKKLPGASLDAIRESLIPLYKKAAQTGDTSQLDAQVRKVVAAKLVSIQTDPGLPTAIGRLFDQPSYDLAAEALIDNPDFKPYDAVLADTSDNRSVLSILFNKSPDAMKTVRETLDDKGIRFTVNNIAAELKQNPIADLQAANGIKDQVYQLAVEAKYSPDFIEYLLKGTKLAYTSENAAGIIKALQEEGTVGGIPYATLLQRWIGSNGRQ